MHTLQWNAIRALLFGSAGVLMLASCGGPDFGQCDMTKLGGSTVVGMEAPTAGQVVINASCSRCHSALAKGKQRTGAPAELNFDLVPQGATADDMARVDHGKSVVHDWKDTMWEEIDEGEMPPAPPAGSGKLSSADKETVRNWMACGAPVVNAAPAAGTGTDWTSIYNDLVGTSTCLACHMTGGAAAGGGFALGVTGDACGAYANLVNMPASGPSCANMSQTLVIPGNPEGSLLIRKLTDMMPACGGYMPQTGSAPLAATNAALVARISAWIMANAPKPATCP